MDEWQASGLGPLEFCRRRRVAIHRLTYWRRRLDLVASELRDARRSDFVEVVVPAATPASPADGPIACIEIVVGDVTVRLPDRPELAARVVSALARRSA